MEISEITEITEVEWALLLDADPAKELVAAYVNRSRVFGMEEAGKVVGIMVLLPTRPDTLEIVNIATDADYRGQGIATKLIQFALHYASNAKYHRVEIGTGSTGFEQLYLYQKCGFRMVAIEQDFFVKHYPEPIIENNLVLKDMVRLAIDL
ncbi:GNAT family N-acetyltransferase [Enterococcus sp. LJL90]